MAGTDEYAPTFALIDTDQDGFISAGEFKKLLDVLGGGSVADETAAAMFAQMDADGDGKVDLDELSAYLQASRGRNGDPGRARTAEASRWVGIGRRQDRTAISTRRLHARPAGYSDPSSFSFDRPGLAEALDVEGSGCARPFPSVSAVWP